jgi:hypothetical protein
MGWELKTTPVSVAATRELAKEFAEMTPAPHDRALSERRLEVYEKLVEGRQFRPVTWAKAWCLETQDWYRVNGKHTSVLLAERLKTIPKGFHVIIETYECDTLEDVAKLYATFDSKMQSRTARDIYLSFASTCPELAEMDGRFLTGVVSGMGYHSRGDDYWDMQPAERAEILLSDTDFVVWAWRLFGPPQENVGHVRKILRQGILAAMYGTYLKDRVRAEEFWKLVRDESSPTPDTPDRKLARYLATVTTRQGGHMATREMMVKAIHAWNAWKRKEKSNLNYYKDKEVPKIL